MNIYLDTVGCRLNQSEIETMGSQFRIAGHLLVADPADADLAVVNTCTVTAAAASDSRKKIRGMKRAGISNIVVTGCWSTLEPGAAARLPGVNQLIANAEKDYLVPLVLDLPMENFESEPIAREPLPGQRGRTRAFIKVQDGCDNHCTFCITTLARGPGCSRTIPEILEDIRFAQAGGTQEIVISGVHLGSWGQDFDPPCKLSDLIKAILIDTDIPRLRLSSLEPWDIEKDFFDLWQDSRLANHLHLPLQSGSASILKRMARKITPESYAALLEAAHNEIEDLAVTTDIITGFPGEGEDEFQESLVFIEKMAFARGHVFTFSEREGTAAARMPDSVPYPLRKSRNAQVQRVLARSELAFRERFLGSMRPVLWEKAARDASGRWILSGLTDNYLRATATTQENRWNQISKVRLTGINDNGIVAEIV